MRHLTLLLATTLALAAAPALAEKPGKGACPPGLAKKGSCTPPGLAAKPSPAAAAEVETVEVPDSILLLDPAAYPDWCESQLVLAQDAIYRIDPATGLVLDLIGPASDWTWAWDEVDFAHCPPGLAKKNPPCIPPGQARKYGIAPLSPGDIVPAERTVLVDPQACTPIDQAPIQRSGDQFFQGLSGEDQAILALSLLAASMK